MAQHFHPSVKQRQRKPILPADPHHPCRGFRGGRSQTCTTQSHHRDQESRCVPRGARGVPELLTGEQRELSPAQERQFSCARREAEHFLTEGTVVSQCGQFVFLC